MKDLTQGSLVRHILIMAAPVAISMLTQIAYHLIDLYFITRIGAAATAGVNAANNAGFILLALMQVIGVGAVSLVAQAAGRQDRLDANLIFNQSVMLSALCGITTMTLLAIAIYPFLRSVAADEEIVNSGATFAFWLLPGHALVFLMTVLGSSLRGLGVVGPTIAFHALTVVTNAILAPILIAGWVTGMPLGVKGAGLATSISILVGTVALGVYFHRSQRYVTFERKLMRPNFKQWRRILTVGAPMGAEVALMFVSSTMIYYAIRSFGASAQAGYGIGLRVMQTVLLPGISIAFAAGPIAGQNFGARNHERVRQTFCKSILMCSAVMAMTAVLAQWWSSTLVGMFNADAATSAIAIAFLQLMSWIFVAQGVIYICSSMFQAFGNTVPSLISSAAHFLVLVVPMAWVSTRTTFRIQHVWYLAIAAVTLQSLLSLWLLRHEFRRRLTPIIARTEVSNQLA